MKEKNSPWLLEHSEAAGEKKFIKIKLTNESKWSWPTSSQDKKKAIHLIQDLHQLITSQLGRFQDSTWIYIYKITLHKNVKKIIQREKTEKKRAEVIWKGRWTSAKFQQFEDFKASIKNMKKQGGAYFLLGEG